MSGIKYYQLAKGEELPDEFCVVKDMGGEPSEYVFYVPEAENVKLRELLADALGYINHPADATWTHKKRKEVRESIADRMRELGVEVE